MCRDGYCGGCWVELPELPLPLVLSLPLVLPDVPVLLLGLLVPLLLEPISPVPELLEA